MTLTLVAARTRDDATTLTARENVRENGKHRTYVRAARARPRRVKYRVERSRASTGEHNAHARTHTLRQCGLLARVVTAGPSAPLDPSARLRSAPLGAARPDSTRLSASPRGSARRGRLAPPRARERERARDEAGGEVRADAERVNHHRLGERAARAQGRRYARSS